MENGRRMSQAALAAKEIRAILKKKFPAIKFSVNSQNYSGGSSINVKWIDGPMAEKVEALVMKYQYGSFNAMEDLYEFSNSIDGLPQVKFLFCERKISPAQAKALAAQYAEKWGWSIIVSDAAGWDGGAKAEWAPDVPRDWGLRNGALWALLEFERENAA